MSNAFISTGAAADGNPSVAVTAGRDMAGPESGADGDVACGVSTGGDTAGGAAAGEGAADGTAVGGGTTGGILTGGGAADDVMSGGGGGGGGGGVGAGGLGGGSAAFGGVGSANHAVALGSGGARGGANAGGGGVVGLGGFGGVPIAAGNVLAAALAAQANGDDEQIQAATDASFIGAQEFLQQCQAALIAAMRQRSADLEVEDEGMPGKKVRRSRDLREKPGRGNAVPGVRAENVRGALRHLYDNIRHAHHPALFHDCTHFGPDLFNHFYSIVKDDIAKAFDLALEEEADGSNARKPHKRLFGNEELFFFLLAVLGGTDESCQGVQKLGVENGLSPATISRYFEHACVRSYKAMKADPNRLQWETETERAEQHGLVPGFPLCVGFVDGAKLGRPRTEDETEQERVYDGSAYTLLHSFGLD